MSFVVTIALVVVVIVIIPLAAMLAGAWLIVSAHDENSVLRRRIDRLSAGHTARRASADLDREYEQLVDGHRSDSR